MKLFKDFQKEQCNMHTEAACTCSRCRQKKAMAKEEIELDEAASWQDTSHIVAKSSAKQQASYFQKFPERKEFFQKKHPDMAHFTSGLSVKQAGMGVKADPAKKAEAEKKSLSAYGATRGVSMGGEHGAGQKEPTKPTATKSATTAAPMTSAERLKMIANKFQKSAKQKELNRSLKQKMSGQVPTLSHGGYEDRYDEPHGFRQYSEEVINEEEHPELKKIRDEYRSRIGGEIEHSSHSYSDDHRVWKEGEHLMKQYYDKKKELGEEVVVEGQTKKTNKEKKNEYVANIIKDKLHPSVLPSITYGRRAMKTEEVEEETMQEETKSKMNFLDKRKAQEVHRALKSGTVAPAHGMKVKHAHAHLKKTYGSDWRKKAGINEEVDAAIEEGYYKNMETEKQETERLKKDHEKKETAAQEKKEDMKESVIDEASAQANTNKLRKGFEAQHTGKVASWKNPEDLKAMKAQNPKMTLTNLYKKLGRKAWKA